MPSRKTSSPGVVIGPDIEAGTAGLAPFPFLLGKPLQIHRPRERGDRAERFVGGDGDVQGKKSGTAALRPVRHAEVDVGFEPGCPPEQRPARIAQRH